MWICRVHHQQHCISFLMIKIIINNFAFLLIIISMIDLISYDQHQLLAKILFAKFMIKLSRPTYARSEVWDLLYWATSKLCILPMHPHCCLYPSIFHIPQIYVAHKLLIVLPFGINKAQNVNMTFLIYIILAHVSR